MVSGFERKVKSFRGQSTSGSNDHAPAPCPEIQAGVVLQDPTGRIVVASEQAARLLGVDGPATLVGRAALFDDGMVIRMDGSAFPSNEQPAALALGSGRAQSDTVLGVRRPGAATLWFRVRAEPLMQVGSSVPYMTVSRFIPIASGLRRRDRPDSRLVRSPRQRWTCTAR
jgi:PAS domain-containing protein